MTVAVSSYEVSMLTDVKVPMRDGVSLSADVYLPNGARRFPAVLIRTPYQNNSEDLVKKGRRFASLGYACVIQDCRGRWDSDGEYYPFVNEAVDGFDTQEWIGSEPWSNGRIGMTGGSYGGWVQLSSASLGSSYLSCIAPRVIAADLYSSFYHGGALVLNAVMPWMQFTSGRTNQEIRHDRWRELFRTLPLLEADSAAGYRLPFWRDWVKHAAYDRYWEPLNVASRWDDVKVPALNLGGWYDIYASDTCTTFAGLREAHGSELARRSQLVMGPWWHSLSTSTHTGDAEFGAASMIDLEGEELSSALLAV